MIAFLHLRRPGHRRGRLEKATRVGEAAKGAACFEDQTLMDGPMKRQITFFCIFRDVEDNVALPGVHM